ncbi:glycosyltransferase family 39 protein [Nonomuraea recticatena]|uniref:glycosyltransferase family 39 protein n=1 Tax=Nonomuraea recticatena TaxID=46178 RepID=UPI0031F79E9D
MAAVATLYATVRRSYPAWSALLAGSVLALTPVAVLMFRFNNPDALLVLLLTMVCLAGPAACAVETAASGHAGAIPTAGPPTGGGFGGPNGPRRAQPQSAPAPGGGVQDGPQDGFQGGGRREGFLAGRFRRRWRRRPAERLDAERRGRGGAEGGRGAVHVGGRHGRIVTAL